VKAVNVENVGTLVPLRTLWHFNGAGIGFPQRSCKAEAKYVAKVLPSGQLGKQGGNNPGADTNPPEDQEDAVERVEVAKCLAWFYHDGPCSSKG